MIVFKKSHRSIVAALIKTKSELLEFKSQQGVNWNNWMQWHASWNGDLDAALDHYEFRLNGEEPRIVSPLYHFDTPFSVQGHVVIDAKSWPVVFAVAHTNSSNKSKDETALATIVCQALNNYRK